MREPVEAFATRMEEILQKNDHKGGWDGDSLPWLFAKFIEEVGEVGVEFQRSIWTPINEHEVPTGPISLQRLMDELVDVANVAMMLWDRTRQLKSSPR